MTDPTPSDPALTPQSSPSGEAKAPRPAFDGAAMKAARDAKVKAQEGQAIDLGKGWTLTPDMLREASGQGAGWKLTAKGHPPRWFRDEPTARAWLKAHP